MNILLLTPIYPSNETPKESTPVVHYFAKEWVNMGHNVSVVYYPVNFPKIFYLIARRLQSLLTNIFSSTVRTEQMFECEYMWENVKIKRIPLKKYKPHSKYKASQINQAVTKTKAYCNKMNFIPDIVIGHWVNPQLEIMQFLKSEYNVPQVLIMHDIGRDFLSIYKKTYKSLLDNIDILGFRSKPIRKGFESNFKLDKPWFYCFSGIPDFFINIEKEKKFDQLNKFLFVGTLIKRKYPSEIIKALLKAFPNKEFEIQYVGTGQESKKIKKEIKQNGIQNQVKLLGRINRTTLKTNYANAEIFVMISRNEAFGLVYLEAMASGCITIASRNEGYDGIIIDGVNGFLCNSGDWLELAKIIMYIKSLPLAKIKEISNNAINTAHSMTDKKMAAKYISEVAKFAFPQ